ncbi:MerR family transcriptional regulator [Umezawaea sp. Da 62-37]|uniref:MerR family transcriptional regulator n=1 Tax=Umezawaea sp. Da 62-37 TaxID=3075927 RepID=UPI0028F6CECE|nr:MerR family transcriptional regulator [Umezawaea sp. Da 62-37]WNV82658.1 MerR family transcriptional regulator [Umezawaea sp. Da 62-37]
MSGTLVRIGELAAMAGVSIRTVDYYTGLGLLTPASRTASNYRLYARADADRIAVIRSLETQGVSLDDIAAAFTGGHADVAAILTSIDDDLRVLNTALETATPETQGLLAAIATRVHSLVSIALQIPPDLPLG